MGRPRQGTDLRVKVSLRLDPGTLARVDQLAAESNLSRTAYVELVLSDPDAPVYEVTPEPKRPTKPVTPDTTPVTSDTTHAHEYVHNTYLGTVCKHCKQPKPR